VKTIAGISELLRSRRASAAEIAADCIAAAKAKNPELNALVAITGDEAARAAEKADRMLSAGDAPELCGVPFILKDNISTAGIATTCASKMLENYVPFYDAAVWESLKARGAVMIGKGNMDEFAMGSTNGTSYFGPARNAVNPAYAAGGSSGGVASAVAAGLGAYGIGSDTGGSVRLPASFNGVAGLKPTYGAVSRYGLIAYASSLDQIGPIASNVSDLAVVFDAITGRDARDMTSRDAETASDKLAGGIRGMRIGIADEFFENLSGEIASALEDAARALEAAGAVRVSVKFPRLRDALPAYYVIACAEASSNLGRYDGLRYGHRAAESADLEDFVARTRSEGFGDEARRRIMLGTYVLSAGYYDAFYNKALLIRRAVRNDFRRVFETADVLLTPTAHVTAPLVGAELSPTETYLTDICTVPVNIAGVPAVSVPCGTGKNGLPIGAQLIGRHFREYEILRAALAVEAAYGGTAI
jgi:aspartyl-tRNA(Asn)/glutamyl-tRNA(Gln) amidotransferase subunit A